MEDYVLGRDIYGSTRLDAQHLLWKLYNGYTLHPDIPISAGMKIAEIGTGTGMWLLDLSSQLPSAVQLDGYDVSDDQFPHGSALPANVTMRTLDAFGDVPTHLIEQYDVVHLRFWCCVVKNNDPAPLIQHAARLLKPGGYLQWEDAHLGETIIRGEDAVIFGEIAKSIFRAANLNFGWVGEIENHVKKHDLNIVDGGKGLFPPALVPLCTNTYLAGHAELFHIVDQLDEPSIPNATECRERLVNLIAETKKGSMYNWPPVTLLAQKGLTHSKSFE